nr:ankyrin repeat-containing protein NPR4-like [Ipomoea batatas]
MDHISWIDEAVNCEDFSIYLPLYKASVQGDWGKAETFLEEHNDAIQARLNCESETALHVAAKAGHASFAARLVALLPAEALGLKTRKDGLAPLHLAALYGNIEVAIILLLRDPTLNSHTSDQGILPIHYAASNTRNSNQVYLYFFRLQTPLTPDVVHLPTLLVYLIISKFYDEAKKLVETHPYSSSEGALHTGTTPWEAIVAYDGPINNKTSLSFSQKLIYLLILNFVSELLSTSIFINKLLMHQKAVTLLECLCEKLEGLNDGKVASLASPAILKAAHLDIDEVVLNILNAYPTTAYYLDNSGRNILHIAVEDRCENVFNLIRGTSVLMHKLQDITDTNGNNILHLAGKLAPPHKLNLVSGAALQMQRELQWFKEVQKIALPLYSSWTNKESKTPSMVFTEEHKVLKMEGEKWMKDTENSCTIAAALIVTIVFAAAITVPGGNNGGNGLPIFSDKHAFTLFAISNAASLFTSATSLLVFLSILTSRYAEQDFLYALPNRLIIGLFTLFLSIIFMMIAFSAIVYLVFGHDKSWLRIVLPALACLPVTSFVLLQFPLLVALVSSTYGPGIFNKRGIPQMLF